MWLYPHKNTLKHYVFLAQLFGISLLAHVIVALFFMLLCRGGNSYNVALHRNALRSDVPVVFLPLYKSLKPPKGAGSGSVKGANAALVKKETASVPKKEVALKKEAKATTLASEKKSELPKKNVNKKKVKDTKAQDAKKKKAAEQKKVAEKKVVEKKEPKKEPEKETKKEQKTVEKVEEVKAAPLQQNVDVQVQTAQQVGDGAIYIGQAEREVLILQAALQQELEEHWQPPLGITPDTVCEIAVAIDNAGKVTNAQVVTSSGIVMYDISARTALYAMSMPKVAWGKQITITFKQ